MLRVALLVVCLLALSPSLCVADKPMMPALVAREVSPEGLTPLRLRWKSSSRGLSIQDNVDGAYSIISGPPGGVLMLRIEPAVGRDDAALSARLESFLKGSGGAKNLTEVKDVPVGSRALRGVAATSGEGPSASTWCAVALPLESASGALFLIGGVAGGDNASCSQVTSSASIGQIMRSLEVEPLKWEGVVDYNTSCRSNDDCEHSWTYLSGKGRCCGSCTPFAVNKTTDSAIRLFCAERDKSHGECTIQKKCAAAPPVQCVSGHCVLK